MATTHLVFFFLDGASASGAAPVTLPEYSQYGLVAPSDAPELAEFSADRVAADKSFEALARIVEIDLFAQDVTDWVAKEGLVEDDDEIDLDGDLLYYEDDE